MKRDEALRNMRETVFSSLRDDYLQNRDRMQSQDRYRWKRTMVKIRRKLREPDATES